MKSLNTSRKEQETVESMPLIFSFSDYLIESFYNYRKPECDKEGIAREIIRIVYPEFDFHKKSMKQILVIARRLLSKRRR